MKLKSHGEYLIIELILLGKRFDFQAKSKSKKRPTKR